MSLLLARRSHTVKDILTRSDSRTNLVTNPNFETNTTSYSASGYVLNFDGTDDIVDTGKHYVNDGDITNQLTLSAWVKPDTLGQTSNRTIAGQFRAQAAGDEMYGIYLQGDKIRGRVSNGTTLATVDADSTFTAGQWYHVVMTYDNSTVTLYIDGVAQADTESLTGNVFNAVGTFCIGARVSALSPITIDGSINQVRLWDKGLTAAEVKDIYQGEDLSQQASLLGEWLVEDGSGTTLTDTSGNSNNGTISGATWVPISSSFEHSSSEAKSGSKSLEVRHNIMYNPGSETAPASNTAQASDNWYDGTATGAASEQDNGWHAASLSATETFVLDNTEQNSGSFSAKINIGTTGNFVEARHKASGYGTSSTEGFPMKPSTQYKLTYYMKTANMSGDSNDGAFVAIMPADSAGSAVTTVQSTKVKTDTAWTEYTKTFTTASTVVRGHLEFRFYGHTGTGTLVGDAWLDDVRIEEVSPTDVATSTKYTISGLTASTEYTLSAYFYQASDTDHCGILIPGTDQASVISDGNWNRVSITFTAGATTQDVYFVNFDGSNPFSLDAVMCEEGSIQYPYFDGATTDGPISYAWSGTANASTSTATGVYTGLIQDDSWRAFLASRTETEGTTYDLEDKWLSDKGYTGTLVDKWEAYLTAEGFSGTIDDKLDAWLKSGSV